MATSPTPQYTDFSKDVLGRYVCNGLDEATRSTSGRPDARPFDINIIDGRCLRRRIGAAPLVRTLSAWGWICLRRSDFLIGCP
jgi:hypothetical protein